MKPKQNICKNCGAVVPPGAARCSYCGSSWEPEAEHEYMRSLEQVRGDLDKVGDIGEETFKKESRRVGGRVTRIVVGVLLVFALFYGVFHFMERGEDRRNREEYEWKTENLPALDRLYEEGDYEALLEAYKEAQKAGHPLFDWEHFHFCEFYESAGYAKEFLRMREKGLFEETDAVLLLNDELRFRGLDFRKGIPADDREKIREIISPFENDLTEVFHVSEEELEAFDQMLEKNGGYPDYKACKEYVKNHPEILIEKRE